MSNLISIREAAERKNVSVTSVWRWLTVGYKGKKLFAKRICGQWRINANTYEQFFND